MQAIEFPGALASAAKIASRCRFKDAFAKPGRRRCRGRMGLWECGQSRPRTRNPNAAQIRIVHISTAQPKKNHI